MSSSLSRWLVQVKGEKCSGAWEISIVREDYELGRKSYGWFDERKLLISHNGCHCKWPLAPIVWDKMIEVANTVCEHLNRGGSQYNWEDR